MENKEAIKELSEWLDGCCGGEEIEPTRQALRLAISALQAQEAKTQLSAEGTTFDLISRQAAIEAMSESLKRVFPEHRQIAEKCLKALPSAQPEIEERTEEFAQNVPKEDLISRKAAIDGVKTLHEVAWKNWHEPTLSSNTVIDMIKDLPPAQPEPQWISVSERLPEKYGNYLISIHGEDEPDIGTINPNDKRGWSLCDANGFHWASDKELIVTAWMPIPEPYRAERRIDDANDIT